MPFAHRPDRPDVLTPAFVRAEYEALLARCESAEQAADPAAWQALFADFNALHSYVESEGSRARYRFTKDMRDPAAEETERALREEIKPIADVGKAAITEALLASRHREAVGERFGPYLLRVLEVDAPALAPVNRERRVEVGRLAQRYDKLVASGEVELGGETLTLARARAQLTSPDAARRREAFEAYYGWFLAHRAELAAIFDAQVKLRDAMGRAVGHADFVPLGYAGVKRTDYGPAEAQAFREAVRAHVSPLFARLAAAQAEALGTETLRPWDRGFDPELTLPADAAEPIDAQLDKAGRVFARLSPRLAAHFERMREEGLIDLENRKGKAAGAYCTGFPDEGRIAIFCNSVGDEGDVRTLTHEMGHAFQGWESQWIEAVDLRWPSMDAAEVHSMGMEFLTLPYLDEFFAPEQLARFTRSRWKRAVDLLCYVCVVDHFQHWVYGNPEATPGARDAEWIRLHELYMPGIDWSGEAAAYAAARWYAQLHIFRYPFYYLDYAVAETGAIQLARLDAEDHEACLETYLELCRRGGTQSVLALFEGAGLRSPFDPALMPELMAHAERVLAP